MYQNGLKNQGNWYMVVVGMFGKHVLKSEQCWVKLVHGKAKQKDKTFQKGPSYIEKDTSYIKKIQARQKGTKLRREG